MAIQRLKEAISKTRIILTSMQQNQDCFDREDAEHATRMLRVLSHELEWRVRRLSIAIQEYDSKIIKLIQVMQRRKEILTQHASLGNEELLVPLKEFFDSKSRILEEYNIKLNERMKQLLHKPQTFDGLSKLGETKEDTQWRERVRSILSPSLGEPESAPAASSEHEWSYLLQDISDSKAYRTADRSTVGSTQRSDRAANQPSRPTHVSSSQDGRRRTRRVLE